jgi:cell shape-determining protein MreD
VATLGQLTKAFLPNRENRRLLVPFACFCVAVIGAVLGFVADAYQLQTLGKTAFVVGALAVAGGCIAVLVLLFLTFAKRDY